MNEKKDSTLTGRQYTLLFSFLVVVIVIGGAVLSPDGHVFYPKGTRPWDSTAVVLTMVGLYVAFVTGAVFAGLITWDSDVGTFVVLSVLFIVVGSAIVIGVQIFIDSLQLLR